MSKTTSKGFTVSFGNTPQAHDDAYDFTQDISGGVLLLDVMANDQGGNAKSLYSLDDGTNADGTPTGSTTSDLLTQDSIGAVNHSKYGATIWITADGKVAYDTSTLGNLDYLAQGQHLTDTFTYAIQLGNGAISWATATVDIVGTNDAPVIVSGPQAGIVKEDQTLTVSGAVAASDPDTGDHQHYSGDASGTYGAFAIDAATGEWTYTLNNAAANVQALAEGETHDETFTVTVTDDYGASTSQDVTIHVTGTNDAPIVVAAAGDTAYTAVDETNSPITLAGTLTAEDPDLLDQVTVSLIGVSSSGPTGGLSDSELMSFFSVSSGTIIDSTHTSGQLNWSFDSGSQAFDYLAEGETLTLHYTIRPDDGHNPPPVGDGVVTIVIQGTNDAPVITGGATGTGWIEGQADLVPVLSATGVLDFADVDASDTHTVASTLHAAVWSGGAALPAAVAAEIGDALSASLNTDSTHIGSGKIDWAFSIPNADMAFLAEGETLTLTYNVTVTDAHGASATQPVTFTVTGTNEAPVIDQAQGSAATVGAVIEDTTTQATGQLTETDPDINDQHFWTAAGGSPVAQTQYQFRADSFTITKANGTISVLNDQFDGTLPVPHSASDTTYLGLGGFTESGGKLIFDDAHAASLIGVGTNDPFIGQDAVVKTNLDPTSNMGLKEASQFTIASVFDLVLPDLPREAYGIRATDRLQNPVTNSDGSITPSQQGDSTFQLVVRQTPTGHDVVSLQHFNFDTNTVTTLQNVALNAPANADQIRLVLDHAANDTALHASFQYLDHGTVVGTQAFSATAQLFGTDPGSVDTENWTRAEILGYAPEYTDSTYTGTYGSLDVSQSGQWTYTLDDALASTQSLSQGQHVTDTFQVQVADQHGLTDTRTINVDVAGANDAPQIELTGVPPGATFVEDSSAQLSGSVLVQFSDVDLADTHTVSSSLASASVSGGGTVSPGLLAALQTALTTPAVPFDEATGDGHGQYKLDFSLDNNLVQFLSAGQTLTATYHTTVTDSSPFDPTSHASVGQDVTITIVGTDDAPVATNDSYVTNEDTTLVIAAKGVLANDSDVDSSSLSAVLVNGPQHGSLDLNADGSFTYTPASNYNGSDAFTYKANDGALDGNTAVVDITVNPVNDAPVIDVSHVGGPSSVTVNFDSLAPGSGVIDGAALSDYLAGYGITISSAGPGADPSVQDDQVIYGGGVVGATSGHNVFGESGGYPVSYTLTFAHPIDSFAFDRVTEYPGPHGTSYPQWAATAYDAANNALATVGEGATAIFGGSNPAVHYTLDGPQIDHVTFTGNDFGSAAFANMLTDTWVLNGSGGLSTNEDTPLTISGINVSDVDAGSDPIQVTLGVGHGALSLSGTAGLSGDLDGSDGTLSLTGSQSAIDAALAGLTYSPSENYNGADTLALTADDLGHSGAGGALSSTTSLGLTVFPVDDAPFVFASAPSNDLVEQGGSVAGVSTSAVNLSIGDVDGTASYDTSGWTQIDATHWSEAGTYGTAVLDTAGNTLTYALDNNNPNTNALNTGDTTHDSFVIGVKESDGALTDSAPVSFTIHGTSDTQLELVGAYRIGEGPWWYNNGNPPPLYSGQSGAAYLLGGQASDYQTSVSSSHDASTVTHTAWYDGYGQPAQIYAQNYLVDSNTPGYTYPDYSAFVSDHYAVEGFLNTQYWAYTPFQAYQWTNYVWHQVTDLQASAGGSVVGSGGSDKISVAPGSAVTGGGGADYFFFGNLTDQNVTISDFNPAEGDRLLVDHAAFGGSLQPGGVANLEFAVDSFSNTSQRFLYETANHTVWYDADGSGTASAPVELAALPNTTTIDQHSILVI